MKEANVYTAAQTGREWPIYTGVYYDCHVVSIPQVLSPQLFHEWLTIVASPTIRRGWQGMYCRQLLDSEQARDKVLFGTFGVRKTFVDVLRDPTHTIEDSVRRHGYLICRVDSYYHPHFRNDFRQNHSPGHKVTVVDFDDEGFTILDNNGTHTTVLVLPRADMIDSVLANLYYAYDKEDTFYRLNLPASGEAARLRVTIDEALRTSLDAFVDNRQIAVPAVKDLSLAFLPVLREAEPLRAYGALRHTYKTALTVEFCYNALLEASGTVREHWKHTVGCEPGPVLEAMKNASTGWKYLKMLCKSAETEGRPADYAARAEKALDAITDREGRLADAALAGFGRFVPTMIRPTEQEGVPT